MGAEGEVLSRLLTDYAQKTTITDIEEKVRFIGIDYPALQVFPDQPNFGVDAAAYAAYYVSHIMNYYDSFTTGAQNIVNFINNDKDSNGNACKTQYMLVGYSQGAISVRLAMNLLDNNSNHIVSSYLIGDPWQDADAATFPNQRTVANTSPYTDGIGRQGMGFLSVMSSFGSQLGIDQSDITPILHWGEDMRKSDITVYRDDSSSAVPILSRSLCHENDPTCGFNISNNDINQHLNYFEASTEPGYLDTGHETLEFDKQVKQLINSQYHNTLERKLKQTPSVKNKDTFYNVVNSKPGDICYWDKNSDGNYNTGGLDCRISYSMLSLGLTKMSVKVVDTDGNEYLLSTEDTAADPSIVQQFVELKLGEWYQFHPYGQLNKCIGINQPNNHTYTMQVENTDERDYAPIVSECATTTPETFTDLAETGKQAFKLDWYNSYEEWKASYYDDFINFPLPLPAGYTEADMWELYYSPHYSEIEWIQPVKKLTNGYNEKFYLANPNGYQPGNAKMEWNRLGHRDYALVPQVARAENGILYYNIKSGMDCLALQDDGTLAVELGCNKSNQLFSISHIDAELGKMSVEHDVTPPTSASNLQVTNIDRYNVTLTWDAGTDNRGLTGYWVQINGTDMELTYDTSITLGISYMEEGSYNTYSVIAVDKNKNRSDTVNIGLVTPTLESSLRPKPDALIIENITADPNSVTLNFPENNYEVGFIDIYRNGEWLNTIPNVDFTGSYTDYSVENGIAYNYAYSIYTIDGYQTQRSDEVVADIPAAIIPATPTNVSAANQYGTATVSLTWEDTTNNPNIDVYYAVHRNGELIAYTYTPNYTDINAPAGSITYTVKTISNKGHESEYSSPAMLYILVDTEAPSKPVLTVNNLTSDSVLFHIDSADDVTSNLSYQIYRDDVLIAETYDVDFYDMGLNSEQTYEYKVIATDEFGNVSESSDVLSITTDSEVFLPPMPATLSPPTGLNTIYSVGNVAYFGWENANTTPGVSYDVYRDGVFMDTTWNTYYVDNTVNPETAYQYAVVAKDWFGTQSDSSTVLLLQTSPAVASGPDVTAPSSFKVQSGSGYGKTVALNWTPSVDNNGTVSYKIYRDNVFLQETQSLSVYMNDDSLVVNMPVIYTVKAVDAAGNETLGSGSFSYMWDGA